MHWNQRRDTLSVKGHPLRIDLLPKMVQTLCSKAETLLDQLLLGADRKAFDLIVDTALNSSDPLKWPVDPLRNTDDGFSFVHSSHNQFHPFLGFVLEHIHSDASIFDRYHLRDEQGCLVHKHGESANTMSSYNSLFWTVAMRAYFHLFHEFVDLLMVLAHTSSPGVARGTELGPLRSINSLDGPRNFYFLSGSCAIISNYLKTRSITGRDGYIAHFLPTSVSRLFIYLVGPIREVILAFARQVFPSNTRVYRDYLYVVNGKTVDSAAFTNVLRAYTTQCLQIPLTIAPFRQALKAILRAVFHHHEDTDTSNDPLDVSFGHSTATGNSRYGLVYDDLPGLTENVYADAMDLASRYHSWLGVRPSTSSSPPSGNDYSVSSNPALPSDYRRLFSRLERVLPALEAVGDQYGADHAVTKDDPLNRYLPLIQDTISTTLSHKVPWSAHLRLPPPPPVQETVLIHESRVGHLRSLFKRPNLFFRSLEQGQAIEVVCRRHPHILVVLRTGGGKSAVYQAPSFSKDNGFRVVIIPYISLMEQALCDASAKGIPHCVWSPSTPDMNIFRAKLIFAAVEHLPMECFREWLSSCLKAGYLNGIVIDEAHDILLSRDYRGSFFEFSSLGDIGCQIILLSATISPSMEPALWKVCIHLLGETRCSFI